MAKSDRIAKKDGKISGKVRISKKAERLIDRGYPGKSVIKVPIFSTWVLATVLSAQFSKAS
jgi:hypothetical protein